MPKYLCTKFCQARRGGGIITCQPGKVYAFDGEDVFPVSCMKLMKEKETTAAPAAPVAKKATAKKSTKKTE